MGCKACQKPKVQYRKGLWSSQEDEKLRDCILRYGHGCWSTLAVMAGLQRTGKSCRLRWINHLRPGLKHGTFSLEEEETVMGLHAKLGNNYVRKERLRDAKNMHGAWPVEQANCRAATPTGGSGVGGTLGPCDNSQGANSDSSEPVDVAGWLPGKVMFADWFDMGAAGAFDVSHQLEVSVQVGSPCGAVDSLHGGLVDGGICWGFDAAASDEGAGFGDLLSISEFPWDQLGVRASECYFFPTVRRRAFC